MYNYNCTTTDRKYPALTPLYYAKLFNFFH